MSTATDEDLAVELLRATPTHENRPEERLRDWARIALAFGDELAATPDPGPAPETVDRPDGVRADVLILAEYDTRRRMILVHPAGISRATEVLARAGCTVTRAELRATAVAHEIAHHRMHGGTGRELARRLGHTTARIGRWRIRGHVTGAEEIAAHRFAHLRTGLERSPLLLTTVLAQHTFGG
ncbi:hypothetical protein CFN78_26185 [Amycolatopsis antarctica]|uniref:Uncharacterized protein n=1 Tax=Amycolatopsis antarctica TaxID=1854586 RepID=A0A263CVP4_9PSEU|nr:hypothetical protein [Amycolatopsis antarctica]OZM70212.1 hypothetical protein CFN78_26185 [Amycolatopsis antarctica]